MFKTLLLVGCAAAASLNGDYDNQSNDTKSGASSLRPGHNQLSTQENGVDIRNFIGRRQYDDEVSSSLGSKEIDGDSRFNERSELAPGADQEEYSGRRKGKNIIDNSKDLSDKRTGSTSDAVRSNNPDTSKRPKLYVNDINRLDLSTKESARKVLDKILDDNRYYVDRYYKILKDYKAVKEAISNNDDEKLKKILKQPTDSKKPSAKVIEDRYSQYFRESSEELRLSNMDYFSIVDYLKATNKY